PNRVRSALADVAVQAAAVASSVRLCVLAAFDRPQWEVAARDHPNDRGPAVEKVVLVPVDLAPQAVDLLPESPDLRAERRFHLRHLLLRGYKGGLSILALVPHPERRQRGDGEGGDKEHEHNPSRPGNRHTEE